MSFFFHDDDVIKTQGHFIRRSRRILTEQQSTATRSSSQLTSHRDPNIPFLSTRSPVIVYPLSLARSIFITLQAQLRFAIRVELRFQRSTMINLDNHAEGVRRRKEYILHPKNILGTSLGKFTSEDINTLYTYWRLRTAN